MLSVTIGSAPGFAQTYPARPVRIINPYPAGGAGDQLLRPIAQKLSDSLKGAFIVDNRPGANGIIGTEIAVKSPADGYTLVMGSTSTFQNAAIYAKLPYDAIKDLAPISPYAYTSLVLNVHPSVPAASVKQFIALAKAHPAQITYGSFGVGSNGQFAGELFSMMAGVKLIHVPYKGSAPLVADLVGGQIASCFDTMQNSLTFIRAKRLRALGIAELKRSPAAPDIPTISESGLPGFEFGTWFGLLAPANTPREIVNKLNAEVAKAVAQPDLRESYAAMGTEPRSTTPEQFAAQIRSDIDKWSKIAREANIRAD